MPDEESIIIEESGGRTEPMAEDDIMLDPEATIDSAIEIIDDLDDGDDDIDTSVAIDEDVAEASEMVIGEEHDRGEEICSLLIANGYIAKQECQDLIIDEDLREVVERRLESVGLTLVYNLYSDAFGVRLNARAAADDRLEWSNNLGLERGAQALLLILWCKLVLPKRLSQQGEKSDKPVDILEELVLENAPRAVANLEISRDQIMAEFAELLGGVSVANRYISQLTRARLIRSHSGMITEGPLLALAIDETSLDDEMRREVLLGVLKGERGGSD